ncbi:MAG: tetratricopeptide repeat protein [Candidatus Omnitrophota bacterium]|nr:tetratricopeptide repeat protein [Candidatus Omnitrophota bacterium]
MKDKLIAVILGLSLAAMVTVNCPAQVVENNTKNDQPKTISTLEQGIGQYKHENYEEALTLLKKAREQDPQSTLAAYYLGLTYKQLQSYKEAIPPLKDAVTLSPKIVGALMELVDCFYQLDELEEAKKWIAEAEKEGIRPAQIAFLKGLVLLKDADALGAIEAFKNAKSLDKSMEQSCDYQIGIAHLKAGKFSDAKEAFREVFLVDPNSNMANFANRYVDAITEREREMRPWKFSFGTAWQYDDNVVLKPGDDTVAVDITDEGDSRYVYTAQAEYNKRFGDKFGLKGQYMFYYGKQNDLGFYNQMSHTFVMQPSLYFKNSLLTFPTAYNHTIVNDRSYLSSPSTSAIYNFMVGSSNMGQTYLRYQNENYLWTPSTPDENRDSNNVGAGFGWYFFYKQNKGFLNLRYGLEKKFAQGNNWEYLGYRPSATLLVPVMGKLNATFSVDYNIQDFTNSNTIFHVYRKDKILTLSALVAYKFYKDSEIQLQHTFIKDDSNVSLYSYNRNIYSVGVEVKF